MPRVANATVVVKNSYHRGVSILAAGDRVPPDVLEQARVDALRIKGFTCDLGASSGMGRGLELAPVAAALRTFPTVRTGCQLPRKWHSTVAPGGMCSLSARHGRTGSSGTGSCAAMKRPLRP